MKLLPILALLLAPLAAAQAPSDSDYDTTPPADDASYLADDGIPPAAPDAPSGTTTPTDNGGAVAPLGTKTPGLGLVVVLGVGALAALALRRR